MANVAGQPVGDQPTWDDYYAGQKKKAAAVGTNAGTAGGNAINALTKLTGLNPLGSSSSSGSSSGSGGSGPFNVGGTFPTIAPPGGGGTPGGGATPGGTSASDAIFNRAKDKVGQASQGALTGLRESMGARGMLGSGLESRGTEQIAEKGLGELGDTVRQQAITEADIARQQQALGYQGSITQRGQDMSLAAQSMIAKNQQAAQQAQMLQGLLSVLPSGLLSY